MSGLGKTGIGEAPRRITKNYIATLCSFFDSPESRRATVDVPTLRRTNVDWGPAPLVLKRGVYAPQLGQVVGESFVGTRDDSRIFAKSDIM